MPNLRNLQYTIDALAAFPNQLNYFYGCFARGRTNWKPPCWDGIPSERLTAIEQICHIFDVEVEGYQLRFSRIVSELAPDLPDLPGERMAIERQYANYDAPIVLRKFAEARAKTVEAIKRFSHDELDRVGIFENKLTTLAGMVHFLCSHDCQHLSGLQWLLGKLEQERQ
jgi:DinB superfamily